MLCVKDGGPHTHPSAGHRWQETGGPSSPQLTAILSVSASQEGRGWPLKITGPPKNVKGKKLGVAPCREPGWELFKNSPFPGRPRLTNPIGSLFPQGPS